MPQGEDQEVIPMPQHPTTAQSPKAEALLRRTLLAGVSLYAIAVTAGAQATTPCASNVISTVCTGPITTDASFTSFTVTGSGAISNGPNGLFNSDATLGTLSNAGTIAGTIYHAIDNSRSIGTVLNTGIIRGSWSGLFSTGSIGTFDNAGQISGATYDGVFVGTLGAIGAMTNQTSGTISGYNAAVNVAGSIGSLANSGVLVSAGFGGVMVDGTLGTLVNNAGGVIFGTAFGVQVGYDIAGATLGSLINANTIVGGLVGVGNVGAVGALINGATGTISGEVAGIANLSGTGFAGTILQSYSIAIVGTGTIGALTNSGTILGGAYGAYNDGSIGTLTNGGLLVATATTGLVLPHASAALYSVGVMNLGQMDTLTNLADGYIVARTSASVYSFAGVYNNGSMGVLNNAGDISASIGIFMGLPGSIGVLSNSGTITGESAGIQSEGFIGTLNNTGVILGEGEALQNAGTIGVLFNSGTIISSSSAYAISNNGAINTLSNSGTIYGYSGVTNNGTIGVLSNSGGIYAQSYAGVSNGGSIGTLTNSGTIAVAQYGYFGVYNAGSIGVLTNTSSGLIQGKTAGIDNDGSIGQLSNSGTITGISYGIRNASIIGTLTNSGLIHGERRGILASSGGYIGALFNSGTISGDYGINSDGTIGFINNTGEIISSDSDYAISNDGSIGSIINSNLIHGYTGIYSGGSIDRIDNSGRIHGQSWAGVDNDGVIGTLTNSGTITTDSLYNPWNGSHGVTNRGTIGVLENTSSGLIFGDKVGVRNDNRFGDIGAIGTLINAGAIRGGETGIRNMGVMGPLVNSGSITGGLYALNSSGTGATIGAITNSGVINGYVLVGNQDVTIQGGSGSGFGTIMGGSVVMTDGNLTFGAGNQLLASNIAVKGGAGTVTLGGTLQANTPVAISGNLVQSNGSLLILGIDAASQGRLNVTGTVDMTNGAVRVQPLNGFKLARNGTYTLVDSATPAGTSYAGVQLSLSGYRGFFTTPMIDGHYNLVLNIRSSDYTAIGRASGATPGNMGSTLDQLAANSGAFQQQVLTHIDDLPEGKRQQDAVRQTAPVQTSASAVALNVSAALTTQVVEQHQIGLMAQDGRGGGGIAAGSGGSQKRMWLRVMGGYSNRSTTATVDGYSSRSGGMMIGLDYNLSPTAVVGIGASMMQGRTNTGGVTTGSTTLLTNYSLTAYGTWQFRPGSFVFGQAGGGSNSFIQRRQIGFLGATARSQFSGYQFQLKGGLGHDLHLTDSVTLTPMATLQYLRADTQGYGETGAGLANLQVNRSRVDALVHEVGARVSGRWETPLGTILPEMRLSWTHDYIVGPIAATGQLAGATFFSTTSRLAPDGARLNLAGTLLYSDRLTVRAEYQGDLRSNYNAHTGMLRASLAF
jgi:outer membrane autotransporter protein